MARCFTIDIPSPCTVGWDNLVGDDLVRHCNQCSKNVFNLSDMTEQEVANVFEIHGDKVCVSIRTRLDGTVYTDNCPYHMRRVRNLLRAQAPVLLLLLAWAFQQTPADAQGLAGPTVVPRFGQSNEVVGLQDYGYDTARDISRIVTAASVPLTSLFSLWRIRAGRAVFVEGALSGTGEMRKATTLGTILWWLSLILIIPFFIHLICTLAINNFGNADGL